MRRWRIHLWTLILRSLRRYPVVPLTTHSYGHWTDTVSCSQREFCLHLWNKTKILFRSWWNRVWRIRPTKYAVIVVRTIRHYGGIAQQVEPGAADELDGRAPKLRCCIRNRMCAATSAVLSYFDPTLFLSFSYPTFFIYPLSPSAKFYPLCLGTVLPMTIDCFVLHPLFSLLTTPHWSMSRNGLVSSSNFRFAEKTKHHRKLLFWGTRPVFNLRSQVGNTSSMQ